MIDVRLNLNDNIKVKLTDLGKDIYYHRFDCLNTELGREVCKPTYPKVDEDGYTTFQLWCFMGLYGVHMGMTLPNVIEPLDIVFDAPTIEPERKKGEWLMDGEKCGELMWRCSECRVSEAVPTATSFVSGIVYPQWKYCPNCGVNMMEEGDHE